MLLLSWTLSHPGSPPNVGAEELKGIQWSKGTRLTDFWHKAGLSDWPSSHSREFSMVLSPTAFKQYQASPLELFLAILYSCGDSSLGEIQPAESLISCSWSQKFLFDVAFWKKKEKKNNFWRKKVYNEALWVPVLKPVHFWRSLTIITIFLGKVLGAEKNTRRFLPRREDVGCHRQDSRFCLHHKVEDIAQLVSNKSGEAAICEKHQMNYSPRISCVGVSKASILWEHPPLL